MDVLASGGVTIDDEPTGWVAALADWIGQDIHPRFIINSDLECLWKNDAARKMLGENGASVGAPMSKALTFFDQVRLRSLLQDAEDDLVHWGVVPDRNGVSLVVWAKAIGVGQNRMFGLVLMPPDHEPSFREFFENARLTPAEARIIDAILRGESLANTASVSGVSKETIKTQLKNAYRKLSVSSRGELFAEARRFLAP
ncbi:helix-turn-helix transcriptional regulator [Caulobacter segnis]